MSALIGRDGELTLLDAALAEACSGAGNCVLVSGEAGIGKSRLIREVRRRAAQLGFLLLEGACEKQDQGAAFAPLRMVLDTCARMAPSQGRHAPPGAQSALNETLARWLEQRAAAQPVLLAVEDIHWSDDASLNFLAYLLARLPRSAMLLVLSYRTPLPDSALDSFLEALRVPAHVRSLKLGPLSRSDVAQIMRRKASASWPNRFYFLQRVYEVTGGNPLFVEELCLSSAATESVSPETDLLGLHPLPQATVPRSVRRIVRQRVRDVSRPAQKLADVCAVHGRAFDLDLLGAVTGFSRGLLLSLCEELVEARLVIRTGAGSFTFRHAMVREALNDRLLVRERRAWHEALIGAMEVVYADTLQAHLADLTYHAYEAGSWERTVGYARWAAQQALAHDAPRAAVAQYTRAIEAADRLFRMPSWDLHCGRASALQQMGDIDGALTDFATALDGARVLGNKQAERAILQELASLLPLLEQAHASDYYQEIVGRAEEVEEASSV